MAKSVRAILGIQLSLSSLRYLARSRASSLINVMKKVFKLAGKISCSGDNTMIRVVETENAPKPIAPYSQAIVAGDFIFVAGQAGINPATGELPENVADQTRQALENIKAILEATGTSLDNVVKTTVFLADLTTYNEMNNVYEAYFKGNPPARSTIQANPPLDILKIEIEAIAYIGK